VIVRDKDGKYHVHTSHHAVGGGAVWVTFWGLLFGMLFFIPVLGMAVGAGKGDTGQGRRGDEQVWRNRSQDLTVQGR
jgi:uncharacterized membrane protein